MNTGTRVHADKRTARRRTRADEERAVLEAEYEAFWDAEDGLDGSCRAGRFCAIHDELHSV